MKSVLNVFSRLFGQASQNSLGDRIVRTKIDGRHYEIASDDNYLEHVKGEFEPEMVVLFKSLLRPTDVVLDIGANIGCTSLLFGPLAKKVYSFEPSPSTFSYLKRNVESARFDNVEPVNVGLGKESGSFELTFSPNDRSGGFVSNLICASQGHSVEKITIAQGDAYIESHNLPKINFIKIDVEGFEKSVIEGLAGTISRDRPIVVLELNHWCLNAFQRISVPDFFDFLRGVFPHLYAVDMRYVNNMTDKIQRKFLPSSYDSKDAKNLHSLDASYHVMHRHILHGFSYPIIVGAFDQAQLEKFGAMLDIEIS